MRIQNGIVLFASLLIITTCKAQNKDTLKEQPQSKFHLDSGKVSHRYVSSGCRPVIITGTVKNGDTLMYVPMQGLGEFDVEGIELSFNYTYLAIMHQKGCGKGAPVVIKNVRKTSK